MLDFYFQMIYRYTILCIKIESSNYIREKIYINCFPGYSVNNSGCIQFPADDITSLFSGVDKNSTVCIHHIFLIGFSAAGQ